MTTERASGLTTDSLTIQAYRHFRQALMSGRYRPGEKIKLKDVSEELGISPTPIREALGRLVSQRILSQIDRRSVCVPILQPEQYKEIRDLRWMLEGEAAARAAQLASPEDIAYMREIHERMCEARDRGDSAAMMAENSRFHQSLGDIAQMPILADIVRNLWLQCGPMMNAFKARPSSKPGRWHPHLDVLRGLETRDSELARRSIQADIMAASDHILRYLEQQRAENDAKG